MMRKVLLLCVVTMVVWGTASIAPTSALGATRIGTDPATEAARSCVTLGQLSSQRTAAAEAAIATYGSGPAAVAHYRAFIIAQDRKVLATQSRACLRALYVQIVRLQVESGSYDGCCAESYSGPQGYSDGEGSFGIDDAYFGGLDLSSLTQVAGDAAIVVGAAIYSYGSYTGNAAIQSLGAAIGLAGATQVAISDAINQIANMLGGGGGGGGGGTCNGGCQGH